MKIHNDKYYTPVALAKELIDVTMKVLADEEITEVIEPSAGNGSFSKQIKCVAYDIEPECESIIKQDFLKIEMEYQKGRLFIGNPPFGVKNNLSIKFFRKCIEFGDYIAFIQPISQLNNNLQLYQFDLVHSQDLGVVEYSNRKLHCCFNVYKRPSGGLNPKPNLKLNDVFIKEYRRGSQHNIPEGYDFGVCTWGNGSLGKPCEYVGQYAQENWFYCKPKYLAAIKDLMEYEKIRDYVKSISAKRISTARLYQYIRDNIEGIE